MNTKAMFRFVSGFSLVAVIALAACAKKDDGATKASGGGSSEGQSSASAQTLDAAEVRKNLVLGRMFVDESMRSDIQGQSPSAQIAQVATIFEYQLNAQSYDIARGIHEEEEGAIASEILHLTKDRVCGFYHYLQDQGCQLANALSFSNESTDNALWLDVEKQCFEIEIEGEEPGARCERASNLAGEIHKHVKQIRKACASEPTPRGSIENVRALIEKAVAFRDLLGFKESQVIEKLLEKYNSGPKGQVDVVPEGVSISFPDKGKTSSVSADLEQTVTPTQAETSSVVKTSSAGKEKNRLLLFRHSKTASDAASLEQPEPQYRPTGKVDASIPGVFVEQLELVE
ncbi:MAG: hypothetical protein AB1540_11860 [Bdellovibrionota bacterium]